MPFNTTDAYGISEINPSTPRLKEIIKSVQQADEADYPDVSLIHDSGWTLTYSASKVLLWENLDRPGKRQRFLRDMEPDRVLELWCKLAEGKIEEIEKQGWIRE